MANGASWLKGSVSRLALATVLAMGASAAFEGAYAQQSPANMAQASRSYDFNIAAKPLLNALADFTAATGIQVVRPSTEALNAAAPAVSGRLTADQALRQMLAGSGLDFRFTDANTVALTRLDAATLPTVTVEAQAYNPNAQIGSLPPEYAGGQVATGARLGMLGNTNVMDTPFNVTAYTSKLIEDQQARSIVDVLANEPTAQSAGPWHFDNFYIRGFNVNREEIGFDGLYGIASAEGNLLEGIERVEILKGPSTLVNGGAPRGTAGGSINLVPKRATDTPLTRLTTTYISDSDIGGHVDVAQRFGADNAIGARVNLAYRGGDTQTDRESEEVGLGTVGLDYRAERVRLSADLGTSKQDIQGARGNYVITAAGLPSAPPTNGSTSQSWEFQDKQNTFGVVRAEYDATEYLSLGLAYGGSRSTRDMLQSFSVVTDTAGNTNSFFFGAATRTDARSGEATARLRLQSGEVKHQIVLAATDFQSDISNYQPAIGGGYATNIYNPVIVAQPGDANLNGPLTRLSETSMRSYALADTLSIFDDRLLLTLGLRHQNIVVDGFNFATGAFESHYDESKVTPALAALVKVTDSVSLYANYVEALSQGATAPSTAVNANEIFAPFISKQGEVGVKVDWGQLTSTLSAFQLTRPSGFLDASNVFTVDGEQRNRGLELQVFGEVAPGIRMLGGAAWTDATLTSTQNPAFEGNRAGGVPEWQLKIGGEWDIPSLRGVTATARVIHSGPQAFDAANTIELPSWTRLDLGARYTAEVEGRPVTFRFSVENVTDNRYWDSEPSYLVATYSMPRTYLFSISADF